MELLCASGNFAEFENRNGRRYRRVVEDGAIRWFTLASGPGTREQVHYRVQLCCKKFQGSLGAFIDRLPGKGSFCIFAKNPDNPARRRAITHCPFCGTKVKFIDVSKVRWKPRAIAVSSSK